MSKELEKIKEMILEQTAHMEANARVELLDDLAWWRAKRRGRWTSGLRTQRTITNNAEQV